VKGNVDIGAVTSEGFVYRVINNFKDEMMETSFSGISDVHSRSLPYRFQAFKNFNLARSVVLVEHIFLNEIFRKLLFFPQFVKYDNTIFYSLSKPE
jgi:hypothetical protein